MNSYLYHHVIYGCYQHANANEWDHIGLRFIGACEE